MADTAPAVLKGVVQALLADAGVTAKVAQRVYSDVPESEVFPYILVELASEPFAAKDFSGQTHTVRQALDRRGRAHVAEVPGQFPQRGDELDVKSESARGLCQLREARS